MELRINGKPADITLENEKTVMDLLAGIQEWLDGSGLVLSGLEIDGKSYGSRSLDEAWALPLDGLSSINIKTSLWAELMLEALFTQKYDLESFEKASPEERNAYRGNWEHSSPALFLKENAFDLYTAVREAIEEEAPEMPGPFLTTASALVAERIREIEDPAKEMKALLPFVEETSLRLEELPLDTQTGKDGKASETIAVFSSLVEKIFRLIFLFRCFQADIDSREVASMNGPETLSLKDYIGEFGEVLKEMLAAFENKDSVLVGDLAEYELAPRLRVLAAELAATEAP